MGQAVTAVVKTVDGGAFDEEALKIFCKEKLAAYKTPKHVFHMARPSARPMAKPIIKASLNLPLKLREARMTKK